MSKFKAIKRKQYSVFISASKDLMSKAEQNLV